MERRQFTKELLAGVTTVALMESLLAFNAVASPAKPILSHWPIRQNKKARSSVFTGSVCKYAFSK